MMFSRMCARRRSRGHGTECAVAVPMEDMWRIFLKCPNYQSLCAATTSVDQELPPLHCWQAALSRACYLWKLLALDNNICQILNDNEDGPPEYLQEREDIWEVICFLIKGTFYVANNLPLSRLNVETNTQLLLHATVGALPHCIADVNDKAHALVVYRHVLEKHTDQLSQPGPVLDRLPLHIAASNKRSVSDPINPPSKVDISKDFTVELLESILEQSPVSAASVADAMGYYPLHLACLSGFSWNSGLELLFKAAPQVSNASDLPNLFVLMAESIVRISNNITEENAKIMAVSTTKKRKKSIRRWASKKVIKRHFELSPPVAQIASHQQTEAADTIFQLLTADPSMAIAGQC